VTASMGMSENVRTAPTQDGFDTLFERADKLLYQAKMAGRNRGMSDDCPAPFHSLSDIADTPTISQMREVVAWPRFAGATFGVSALPQMKRCDRDAAPMTRQCWKMVLHVSWLESGRGTLYCWLHGHQAWAAANQIITRTPRRLRLGRGVFHIRGCHAEPALRQQPEPPRNWGNKCRRRSGAEAALLAAQTAQATDGNDVCQPCDHYGSRPPPGPLGDRSRPLRRLATARRLLWPSCPSPPHVNARK